MLVALAPEAPLEPGRLEPRPVLGLVAQVAPQVGLERPPGGLAAGAGQLAADGLASAASSASSAAGSVAGVSRAEPVLAFRPRSVASSTAWAREPRFIGSGSGLTRRGASRPSTSQRTPQAANVSSCRAPSVRRAASCSSTGALTGAGSARRVGLRARRGLGAPQLARGRRLARRPRHLGEQPAPALGPQLVGEQRAHVVEERRGDQRLALLVGGAPGQEQHLLRARDAGVEQRALAVEHVLVQRQPQPRGGGEPAPRVVVEERLGHRPLRELGVLQPAHEDGAEAPRADLERVGEQHALGRVALAHLDRRQRLQHVLGPAEQRRVDRPRARAAPPPPPAARRRRAPRRARRGRARRRGARAGPPTARPPRRRARRAAPPRPRPRRPPARRGARARPAPSATPPRGRPRSRCGAPARRARRPRPARRACPASAATRAGRRRGRRGARPGRPRARPEPSRVRPSGTRRA